MTLEKLLQEKIIILDGAFGTLLQQAGLQPGAPPELWSIDHPEEIIAIHRSYVDAGSDIIYSNTFGANRYKLAESPASVEEVIRASLANARAACSGSRAMVTLDIGPIGQMLEPRGSLPFEEAYDIFREIVIAGKDRADLIIIEAMTDLREIKAAVLASRENSNLPIICTMSFEENGKTVTGTSPAIMALTIGGMGVDAVGLNSSFGPDQLAPIVEELANWTNLPLIVKPSVELPAPLTPLTNTYSMNENEFANQMEKLVDMGAAYIGGGCGTRPEHIAELCRRFKGKTPKQRKQDIPPAICSATQLITYNQPRIIGERINPTGKKIFQQALIDGNINYIVNQAKTQINAGAEILDVNVGMPGIDEQQTMVQVITAIQEVSDTPLQLDSSSEEVLAAALRLYNGKAIINSVNGKEESLQRILPLVKKYGAAVVGLTLNEEGLPKTVEKRFEIAKKICNRALQLGIPRHDIIIDCLTLTASAEQEAAMDTLAAVKMVKEKLGVRTILGISNISFGLPNRTLLNHSFLAMALLSGLDLAIINPNKPEMTGTVRSYRLLANIDINAKKYIAAYG